MKINNNKKNRFFYFNKIIYLTYRIVFFLFISHTFSDENEYLNGFILLFNYSKMTEIEEKNYLSFV